MESIVIDKKHYNFIIQYYGRIRLTFVFFKEVTTLIFDWDGTIVDSMFNKSEFYADALISMFPKLKQLRFRLQCQYIHSSGMPLGEQMKKASEIFEFKIDNSQLNKAKLQFAKNQNNWLEKNDVKWFPSAQEALKTLSKRYNLTISSSANKEEIIKNLSKQKMEVFFKIVLGEAGTFHKGAPHFDYIKKLFNVSNKGMMFFGDSKYDMKVAKEVGITPIGIIGTLTRMELLQAGAEYTFNNWDELKSLLLTKS